MNSRNPAAGHSAEAEGRRLAKEVSGGTPRGGGATGETEKRKVDGTANAKGRDLAQAVAGNIPDSQVGRQDKASEEAAGGQQKQSSQDHDSARRDRIARAAYDKAEKRGFAPGGDVDDWISAERELSDKEGRGGVG